MAIWNPWHGCQKLSPGCVNCYVYRRDESIGKDASVVTKTGDYDLPIRKNRQGEYKLSSADGTVFACMTSDFFLDTADEWRPGVWDMIRERRDLDFFIITSNYNFYNINKELDVAKRVIESPTDRYFVAYHYTSYNGLLGILREDK